MHIENHHPVDTAPQSLASIALAHFWFKFLGTSGFMAVFFVFYLYLLKNTAYPVSIMPITALDRMVTFQPMALSIYASLWLYVSLPVMLMQTRRDIVRYGLWIGSLCVTALTIFYFFPTAVPPAEIDWAVYPGTAFLKGVDAAGNACPSLHVGTAVFSAFWLHWLIPQRQLGFRTRVINVLWCVAIAYSTLATKQHVAVDMIAGAGLGALFAWWSRPKAN